MVGIDVNYHVHPIKPKAKGLSNKKTLCNRPTAYVIDNNGLEVSFPTGYKEFVEKYGSEGICGVDILGVKGADLMLYYIEFGTKFNNTYATLCKKHSH